MSPNKTLYIRDEDMPLWEQAEKVAKSTRQSVSLVVASALRRHLSATGGKPDEDLHEITVDVDAPPVKVGFVGRWLVKPEPETTRTYEEGYDAGAYWGIALTKRGRIAVYSAHRNEKWPASLKDYDSLDEAEQDGVPEDLIAVAAGGLASEERVLWRDI